MRQDIVGGMRNAIDRGSSIEEAVKSFMAAGYPEAEVREAAKFLDTGVLPMANPVLKTPSQPQPQTQVKPIVQPQIQPKPQPQQLPQLPQQQQQAKQYPTQKLPTDWIVIVLSSILFLSVIAFIASLIYRQQIASFLSG